MLSASFATWNPAQLPHVPSARYGIPAEDLSKIIAFCVSLYDALIAEVPVLAGFSISRTEMRLLPADVFLMLYCVSRTGMFGSAQ